MAEGVPAVFIRNSQIPKATEKFPTCLEVCCAIERSLGQGTIIGAQQIRGLWRIYPASSSARNKLLLEGFSIRQVSLNVVSQNPFVLRDSNSGVEKPSTKLWIDDVPISVADSEIEFTLKKLGCELRSEIKKERARDADSKLTRFLTGRRFVFITTPHKPLEKNTTVGFFVARLFHKEQKMAQKMVKCSNCLEEGHHKSVCEKEVVCQTCRKPGHKRGDEKCSLTTDEDRSVEVEAAAAEAAAAEAASNPTGPAAATVASKSDEKDSGGSRRPSRDGRGRQPGRQQANLSEFVFMRSRSETPKRRRSGDRLNDIGSELLTKRQALTDNNKDNGTPYAAHVDSSGT